MLGNFKEWVMKKRFSLLWSLLAMVVVCACSKSGGSDYPDPEKAGLTFQVTFDKTGMEGRAPQSTAIPETSWANVKQLQFLLYNASGQVVYSTIVNPSSALTTFTYVDVPVGTGYTLVAVANVKSSSDAVTTYIDGGTTPTEWTMWNVRQKTIPNLLVEHKASAFPTFCSAKLTTAGNTAYTEPSEIFMGAATSMNVKESETDNENTVDFTKDASIMIYRLPENMKVGATTAGGVSATSIDANILTIKDGTVFNTSNPTSGYDPKVVLGGNFTMWRDVIVWPNNGGRTINGASTAEASVDRQYFIVVSGRGKAGHILASGDEMLTEGPVYWSGLIKQNFTPNTIREVNLTLRSGGTTEVPTKPRDEGGLTIDVTAPEAWSSNIVESALTL